MYSEEALTRIIFAIDLYFCKEQITLIASCLPLVNQPCNILEYLKNLGSSLKSSITINIECSFFIFLDFI